MRKSNVVMYHTAARWPRMENLFYGHPYNRPNGHGAFMEQQQYFSVWDDFGGSQLQPFPHKSNA